MKIVRLKTIAIFLIAVSPQFYWANAQNDTNKTPQPACLNTQSFKAPQLYGTWLVTFSRPPAGLPKTAVMLLEKHEEFADSLSGTVSRDLSPAVSNLSSHAAKAALAGDVEDGFVILDESSNNISVSGTWNGQLVEGSCGREIRGLWKDTSASAPADAPDAAFTMLRRPGW